MKKSFKKLVICGLITAMTLSSSMTALAGSWKVGTGANQNRWWYATNEAGTTWHANGWFWIDGNNDGIAECYYFDNDGWMLANTKTPDGYIVDSNGAWTVNGIVQTKVLSASTTTITSTSNNNSGSGNGGVHKTEEPENWEAPSDYNPGPSNGEYARPSMGDGGDGGEKITSGSVYAH